MYKKIVDYLNRPFKQSSLVYSLERFFNGLNDSFTVPHKIGVILRVACPMILIYLIGSLVGTAMR